MALELIAQSRFAVLVGPAGSGKTTLLEILCNLPQVDQRKVLLLAPTGKARVRLEEATKRLGQGKTLAQFLQALDRYDGESGRYYWNPAAPREKGYRTVIVDECSMLTGDQLAALLDAIEGVEGWYWPATPVSYLPSALSGPLSISAVSWHRRNSRRSSRGCHPATPS